MTCDRLFGDFTYDDDYRDAMADNDRIAIWTELLTQKSPPGTPQWDLDTLEVICNVSADVVELPPSEVAALIAEFRRMTPVIVAALAWRSDRTMGGWLVNAIDEYRKRRREAGLEPPAEKP